MSKILVSLDEIQCRLSLPLEEKIKCELFLLPNHFLSKYEKQTAKGRIYWGIKDKKYFCKTYLNIDYNILDKQKLHLFMYEKRGGITFNNHGFPIWKYTNKPIQYEIKNNLLLK